MFQWLAAQLRNFCCHSHHHRRLCFYFFQHHNYWSYYCPVRSHLDHVLQSCRDEHIRAMSCQHSIRHLSAFDWCPTPPLSLSLSFCSPCFTNPTRTHCLGQMQTTDAHMYTHSAIPHTHRQLGRHTPGPVPWEEPGGRWTGRSCQRGRRDTESASHYR